MSDDLQSETDVRGWVSFWQNRRRLFYGAVLVLVIAGLWGGWSWWYRADFPMPLTDTLHSWGASGNDSPSDWTLPEPIQDIAFKNQILLLSWKLKREAENLELAGTVWGEETAGARINFGSDGKLSFQLEPGWDERDDFMVATEFGIFPGIEDHGDWLATKEALDGARWVRGDLVKDPNFTTGTHSLHFPDTDFVGYWIYDGKILTINFSETSNRNSGGREVSVTLRLVQSLD